jgi:hypothetical protein
VAMSIGFTSPVANADPEATKPVIIDAHEPGSRFVEDAVPVPTEDTTCIELIGVAKSWNRRARGVGGLSRWAGDKAGRGQYVGVGEHVLEASPLKPDLADHKRKPVLPL